MFNIFNRTNAEPSEWIQGPEKEEPITSPLQMDGEELIGTTTASRVAAFTSKFPAAVMPEGVGDSTDTCKMTSFGADLSDELYMWFARRGFIGHQLAALMTQNWLVAKCCAMPAKDALRKGWRIGAAGGENVSTDTVNTLEDFDQDIGISKQLEEFICKGRTFGIRVAIPNVEYLEDGAEELPFNIDGVRPGTYRGWVQVDPYWCAPMLDQESAANPASPHFYTPTWWLINGKRYHRSHLCVYTHGQLPDLLKPAYLYGGVPVPQLVLERVYGAERTAEEAPLLTMTKRTVVYKTDLGKVAAKFDQFAARVAKWSRFWNNTGVRVIGLDEEHNQFDTSLTDLDDVLMTQYQVVAAAADVPATKMLGTSPKGFNATGEHEEANYHESLETLQKSDCTDFLIRHYLLAAKSLGLGDNLRLKPIWPAMDTSTALERAQEDNIRAQTASTLIMAGVISAEDEARRLAGQDGGAYRGIIYNDQEQ